MQNNTQTKEIVIDVRLSRHLAIVLTIAILAIVAITWLVWDSTPADASSPAAPAAASIVSGMRRYYLTAYQEWHGDDPTASSVCQTGFHFASLWELMDLSNLEYYLSPASAESEDQGSGPPSTRVGWVRTGYTNDTGTTPGQANCDAWSSVNPSHYGTVLIIPGAWNVPTFQEIHYWDVDTRRCDWGTSVWCIED